MNCSLIKNRSGTISKINKRNMAGKRKNEICLLYLSCEKMLLNLIPKAYQRKLEMHPYLKQLHE